MCRALATMNRLARPWLIPDVFRPSTRLDSVLQRVILARMGTRRTFVQQLAGIILTGAGPREAFSLARRDRRPGLPHPDPRPGITGENVLPESELGTKRRVLEAYEAARTHPEIFDGVYCACRCDKSMNHRSLLSCFESRQAIGCMACREEAELVGRLASDGKTLEEIRLAVDKEFGD